jgi:hypothetical protein
MSGKRLPWIGGKLLHPFAKDILVNIQIARRLSYAHTAFPDQPNRLDLELTPKPSSLHMPPPAS